VGGVLDRATLSDLTWKQAVADCAFRLVNDRREVTFTIDDMYGFLPEFAERFPGNRNPKPKMRQSLQKLRNDGLLIFEGGGRYRLNIESEEVDTESPLPLSGGTDTPQTRSVVRNIRLRNTVLAIEIKRRYGNICQICRVPVWVSRAQCYAEGHHLKPIGAPHFGPDTPGNIIVMCPNHHIMFDRGAATIMPRTLAVLHVVDEVFTPTCRLHVEAWHKLDPRLLAYHHGRIFKA
jgi:5-methylcytosine-specific restriction protein A